MEKQIHIQIGFEAPSNLAAGPVERLFTKRAEFIIVAVTIAAIAAILWVRQDAILNAITYYPV